MKSKKSQAAMEFLMTYGWAILAAVIVIAVLASFGVFSPSTYVSDQCMLNSPVGCQGGICIANASGVTFDLVNGAGEAITISNLSITNCGSVVPGAVIDSQRIFIPCTLSRGSKFKGDINVAYTKTSTTLPLTSSGSCITKVA